MFAPVRSEYVELVIAAPLASPAPTLAFDIGTGTGVLAAVLARRGVAHIVATEQDPRALACARENIARLGLAAQVEIVQTDLFPEGRAPLIVCNPPWIPARPSSPLEHAIYDPESRMLLGFIGGLAAHLEPGGEGWLVLSDIAEHLGLRSRAELLAAFDTAGLKVVGRIEVRPHHPKVADSHGSAARRARRRGDLALAPHGALTNRRRARFALQARLFRCIPAWIPHSIGIADDFRQRRCFGAQQPDHFGPPFFAQAARQTNYA